MLLEEYEYLAHYGILRRSGRYPWGSGGPENLPSNPDKRNKIFLDYINDLKGRGISESDIAKGFDASIAEIRAAKSTASNQQRQANIALAQRLQEKGYSTNAIAKRMEAPESTVRSWLAPGAKDKADVLQTTANMLRNQVEEKGWIDVGRGVENYVGVSQTRLETAVAILREEGYELVTTKVRQVATGKDTNMKVLCPPGTTQREVFLNPDKIQQITNFSDNGGRTFGKVHSPMPIDPKRVGVLYADEGGSKADGMIYLRPGVDDLSLGGKKYGQVRVAVGDKHYIKGMAIHKDDLPDGVDILYCVDKDNTGNKFDAMKESSKDPENPFGSVVRQVLADAGTPNERVVSVLNIVSGTSADPDSGNVEGKWETWSRNLSTQMLSKQSPKLAKTQLDMTYERRQQEYEDIMALTNNTVRKKLLMDFADATDSASVHLKAAAMPNQSVRVILPVQTLSPTEVYAPTYRNGETVVLIRHPHGGTFEIPQLTVNNRNAESIKLLGKDTRDAIGIHHEVAKRMSGADFDGDTVVVIPNAQGRVRVSPALEDLKGFDPRSSYPPFEGMKPMKNTQTEMGKISNLITDMSLRNAPPEHIARAIKHSMVVIDAEKHNLNYRLSYNDNNIKELKQKYQVEPSGGGGASTLISRAGAKIRIPERKDRPASEGGRIDVETGEKKYVPTGKVSYKTGKPKLEVVKRLAVTTDARTLSSGTPMENLYADHSNRLKTMANQARLDGINTPPSKHSPSAKKVYKDQVDSLNAKLTVAKMNAPLERQAQLIANTQIKAKRDYDPNMDDETLKKVRFQELDKARVRTGAAKKMIEITPPEWEAIQAGAISDSKLNEILKHSRMDVVRQLATPRTTVLMSTTKMNRASDMFELGYTRAEVAEALGVSVSTLDKAMKS